MHVLLERKSFYYHFIRIPLAMKMKLKYLYKSDTVKYSNIYFKSHTFHSHNVFAVLLVLSPRYTKTREE